MKIKIVFWGLILLFFTPLAIPQEIHHMRTLKEELSAAGFRLTSATNRFKTNVDMAMLLPRFDETISRYEDSLGVHYYNRQQLNFSGTLSINQPLPTDGVLSLRSQLLGLEDFQLDQNNIQVITGFFFEQPLEAIYSFNRIQAAFREAELNYEQSQKNLTKTELDLRYSVSDAFYRLVAALETEKISKEILYMQRDATELAQNKYKAGVIAEVEALQMEIDLAEEENNFDLARLNRNDMGNALKQMLDLPLVDSIAIESDLSYSIIEVDLEKALNSGLKHRLEIREREIEKELADIQIRRTRVNGQITGSLSAFYGFIGVGEDTRSVPLYNTFQSAWTEMFRRPGNRWVALNIQIPIWDWGVNWANVQAARANMNQTQIALDQERVNIEREIRNTVAQLRSSLRRLQILEKNVSLARKNFDINNQRYTNGEINSQALALDRTRLSQANISHLQAYFDYKLVILDLMRKTFYDFENNKPLFKD
jgi:outer membrane protein TolC